MISLAFPEYDTATLPAIPEGWEDISWRNDVCPSWQINDDYVIFIDFPAMEDREMGIEDRFRIAKTDNYDLAFSSNNWDDVLEFLK